MRHYFYILLSLILLNNLGLAQDTPPNIVLIITDQHSGLMMTQRGYTHINTPGIDKLAEEGVMYTRSYCTYPVCTASRKSFMTGVMPSKLDDVTDTPSIGTVLGSAGYETVYYGKWHVGSTNMDDVKDWHGFETYMDGRDDSDITSWSINFLKKDHSKPFFLITSYLNPHDACEYARNLSGDDENYHDGGVDEHIDTALCPPLPSNFAIPENEAEGFSGRRYQDPEDNYWSAHPTKLWKEADWRRYMWGYDRLVEKVDAHIKEVYDELEAQGLLDNTIIFYTSDHGDGHASHKWNQKKTFYEESVNIPFIVSWKGKTKAGVIDEQTLVSNGLDLYPTILKIAGLAVPDNLHGKDLSAGFWLGDDGTQHVKREYVVSEIEQKVYRSNTPGTFTGRMLVTEEFKYILFNKGGNNEQLFDLQKDPGELNPVTFDPEYHEDLIACRDMLKEWVETTNDNFDVDNSIAVQKVSAKRLNKGQPIIYHEMFTDAGASEEEARNINGPSVIRIPDWISKEDRAHSDAVYYCYFAHHDGEYIRMAWASDIEGPWHLYNVGTDVEIGNRGVLDNGKEDIKLDNGITIEFNHLASPDAHLDHENKRIILYFHAGQSTFVNGKELNSQYSYVSYSSNGLNFYDNIQPVILGSSYFRVFDYKNNLYALSNDGTPYRALDANAPWTPPADHDFEKKLWEPHPNNPFQSAITEHTGLTSSQLRVRHTGVRVLEDELQVFYSRRGDLLENIQMSTIDLRVDDWSHWTTSWPPTPVLQAREGWEGGDLTPAPSEAGFAPEDVNQLRDPFIFEDKDSSLYLFYTGRGEDAIGIASIEISPGSSVNNSAPEAPSLLVATALSGSEINLEWNDEAYNENGFIIERKTGENSFEEFITLGPNISFYTDKELGSGIDYVYRISAFNQDGNSAYSNDASAYTFATDSKVLNYSVVEDSYVRGGESEMINYGAEADLRVKRGSKEDFFRKTLVKFDLSEKDISGADIGQASLRLYANKAEACKITAFEINDEWAESEVVWTNAPASGNALSMNTISSTGYYEWNITGFVKSQLASDRIISCLLEDLEGGNADIRFNSKESVSNMPQLVLITKGSLPQNIKDVNSNRKGIHIYPIPATEKLNISLLQGNIKKAEVYDLIGHVVQVENDLNGNNGINISHLPPGIYLLKVESENTSYSMKFVKRE